MRKKEKKRKEGIRKEKKRKRLIINCAEDEGEQKCTILLMPSSSPTPTKLDIFLS